MVDLQLASSYLPAFVCLAKTLLATAIAHVVIPAGGLPALCVLVQLDRIFLNTDFIFDVNALVAFAVAFAATGHDRAQFGAPTQLALVLTVSWTLLTLTHIVRPYLRPRAEFVAYATLAAVLSMTFQPPDPPATALARAAAYATLTLAHIYWHAATAHDEPLPLTAARFGAIMLGSAPVAMFTAAAGGIALGAKWHWRAPAAQLLGPHPPPDAPAEPYDPEAATALRELLASRKEKGGK
jgi:hypothetical protein